MWHTAQREREITFLVPGSAMPFYMHSERRDNRGLKEVLSPHDSTTKLYSEGF